MNALQLAPATTGGVDRPPLVPAAVLPPDLGNGSPFQQRAARRRLNVVRIRALDPGLRPFRVG